MVEFEHLRQKKKKKLKTHTPKYADILDVHSLAKSCAKV